MKPKVYVETTVVSYLTAWTSRDIVMHAHQQVTREWWSKCRDEFEHVTSQVVVREASAGDPMAAQERLKILAQIEKLETTEAAVELARKLIAVGAVPEKAAEDALHIAIAAVNGVAYLVTWNCRHMANAALRKKIEQCCRDAGYEPPIICTPEELLGE